MSALPQLLEKFHHAILSKNAEVLMPAIKRNPRLAPEQQLAIYIDGYRIRLVGAIRSDYPALLALLGEKNFDALARNYIEAHPPTHFSLNRYPHAFAGFLKTHSEDRFAMELAALEAAIAEVFMAEESEPMAANAMHALTPEAFGAMKLLPRTASRLLAFAYPVNDWLEAQRSSSNVPERPLPNDSYVYVYRHQNTVQRVMLEQSAWLLLSALNEGAALGDALEGLERQHPEHIEHIAAHLQQWFSLWMEKGFFRSLVFESGVR